MEQLIKTLDMQLIQSDGYLKSEENNKIYKPYNHTILKVVRDEETGEKKLYMDDDPSIEYYIEKDAHKRSVAEIRKPKPYVNYIEADKVNSYVSSINNNRIYKDISMYTGREQDYQKWKANNESVKQILSDRCVHGADINIEDFYISQHYKEFPFDQCENILTKGFFDIEVDSINIAGFPEAYIAECPINAISLYLTSTNTLYGFFLRNPNNPLIEDFEKNHKSNFMKRIIQKYKDRGIDIKLKMEWYDEEDEIYLINRFFNVIHHFNPDTMMAWNLTSYDIKYIINRIRFLGYDPNDIVCHEDIPVKFFKLKEDTKNQDFGDRNSVFSCSDYTIWLDQLLLFANLRKGAGRRESYQLDAIVFEELKENKHEFKDPNTTIKNSAYVDYEEFIEYNLHDTVLLYLLEKKNRDADMIYTVAGITETRIHSALKKTTSIRNLARKFYLNKGYIMSNNHNINYSSGGSVNEKKDFRGALTYERTLNIFNCGKLPINLDYYFKIVIS